jgi:DNA-binding IclR family transcriptional regulator
MTKLAAHQHQSARRAIRLLWALQGHAFDGLRLIQAAELLGVSSPTALRDLQLLADEGVAERIPGNEECWRLTPKLIQLARAHDDEMRRMRARIDDIDQRYTRTV